MKKIILIVLIFSFVIYGKEYLSDQSEYLDIYFEKLEDGGYKFYADNRHFIPQFVSLGFTKLVNLNSDKELPLNTTIPPKTLGVHLVTLTPKDTKKGYSFRSSLRHSNGDPLNAEHDGYIYSFPFEHGKKFKIDQGYGGTFSHKDENMYALDFGMDIGTPIHAARSGVVIEVKEDSNRGGRSKTFASYGNFISIYHADGTFSNYVHLKQNGAIVEVGDVVKAGDIIGYSGNTGLSTGPHLHFSVNLPTLDGGRESIPTKFYNHNGEIIEPEVGTYYYANHRGMEPFTVEFGTDITNEDYADYMEPVEENDKLNIRYEKIDNTTIVYCGNGFNANVEATFKISKTNASASKELPIDIVIPPLTEVFLCFLRPIDPNKGSSYRTSVSYLVDK